MKIIMTNIFGIITMALLFWGTFNIIYKGTFEIHEITFLMFASFVLTTIFGSGGKNGKQDSEKESTLH
jgi:hypothetical protein